MLPPTIALLLINVQKAWDEPHWGARSHPEAEVRIQELLSAFRRSGRPVVHIRHDSADAHSPLHPREPGHAFKPEGEPLEGERVLGKMAQSAFVGSELEAVLRGMGVDRLVVAGFTAAHDVSSTVRTASDLGFKVLLMRDAIVAFELEDAEGQILAPDQIHRTVMAELQGTFGVAMDVPGLLPHIGA
ncbi:isochorismatase family protein [Holophaga foetida]|uniref:isochorismatase family protein n=1 Tax=Holophaga foetida TaxID=35839 RepID=UPI0002472155|nr:isochorismatase family protein [Holophaga foetida]